MIPEASKEIMVRWRPSKNIPLVCKLYDKLKKDNDIYKHQHQPLLLPNLIAGMRMLLKGMFLNIKMIPYRSIFIGVLFIYSCNAIENKSEDSFYKTTGAWDYYSLPLIKPYTLISAKTGYWHLQFPPGYLDVPLIYSGLSISKVYVDKGYIYGYGKSFQVIDSNNNIHDTAYFIISTNDTVHLFSHSIRDYTISLSKLKLDPEAVEYVDFLYEEFIKTKKLRWPTPG